MCSQIEFEHKKDKNQKIKLFVLDVNKSNQSIVCYINMIIEGKFVCINVYCLPRLDRKFINFKRTQNWK